MKKICAIVIGIVVMLIGVYFYSYVDKTQYIYDKNIEIAEYEPESFLWNEEVLEQQFVCQRDGLHELRFRVGTYGRKNTGDMDYVIYEGTSNDKIVAQGKIDMSTLTDSAMYELSFDEVKESKGKNYRVVFTSKDVDADNGIAFYKTHKNSKTESKMYISGEEDNNSMVMRVITNGFDIETYIVMIFLIAYICVFVKILFILFN